MLIVWQEIMETNACEGPRTDYRTLADESLSVLVETKRKLVIDYD